MIEPIKIIEETDTNLKVISGEYELSLTVDETSAMLMAKELYSGESKYIYLELPQMRALKQLLNTTDRI